MTLPDVLAQRLATQRLTGPPAASAEQAVAELLCVQAQDAPLARWSLAQRTGLPDAAIQDAVNGGRVLRTHVLRPTWHFVAAADLRWLLAVTSPKVLRGLAGRHRQLGLTAAGIDAALAVVAAELTGRRFRTRGQLGAALAERRLVDAAAPEFGSRVGHLMLVAELRGLVCSGPVAGGEHGYALLDEIIEPARLPERADGVRELVHRFFGSHGPVAVTDLVRWTRLTRAEIGTAVAELGDRLAWREHDGARLWFVPERVLPEDRPARALLLSTFDEAFLSYRTAGFPRAEGHPAGQVSYRFAETGGGVVVCDRQDVGRWARRIGRQGVSIALQTAPLTGGQRAEVERAARLLGAHLDLPATLTWR